MLGSIITTLVLCLGVMKLIEIIRDDNKSTHKRRTRGKRK